MQGACLLLPRTGRRPLLFPYTFLPQHPYHRPIPYLKRCSMAWSCTRTHARATLQQIFQQRCLACCCFLHTLCDCLISRIPLISALFYPLVPQQPPAQRVYALRPLLFMPPSS